MQAIADAAEVSLSKATDRNLPTQRRGSWLSVSLEAKAGQLRFKQYQPAHCRKDIPRKEALLEVIFDIAVTSQPFSLKPSAAL